MGNSMFCCEDLVQVWTVDRVGESYKFGDNLKVFFPVLTDEARQAINVDFGTDCLAGVVMNEVLLLRLCMKFGFGVPKQELQRDIQNLAVQTIKGFQNYCFLDMLLRMQLESTLPVTIFLSSEDVVLLRKVLYDAMILFDHSSLNFVRSTMLFDTNLKDLALLWSIVADYAIQFAREICDHNRAISYVNTFSKSHLPSQLINWVANQAGMETNLNRPNISTPSALIRWLFVVEDRTSGIFGHGVLKLHAKAVICRSRDYNSENVFFHVRNGEVARDRINEDQVMADSMGDSLLATEGRRKRKEETRDGETPVKHVKYNFPKNSDGTKLLPFLGSDDLKVGSLVNNAVCDECMEDMG